MALFRTSVLMALVPFICPSMPLLQPPCLAVHGRE
nr:MAG TPA: hypothetical protein [Caudoviricetes sp.]